MYIFGFKHTLNLKSKYELVKFGFIILNRFLHFCPPPPPVCKFVSIEMKSAFDETGKTKEVIGRNYGFIDSKGAPPIKYVKS